MASRTKAPARRTPSRPRKKTTAPPTTTPTAAAATTDAVDAPVALSAPPLVLEAADPHVADVRDRAADVADLLRETADQEARVLLDGAKARAGELLAQAHTQSVALRMAAAADARQVRDEVTGEAGRRLRAAAADADQQATVLLEQAAVEAAGITVAAEAAAAAILEEARVEGDRHLAGARTAAADEREQAEQEATALCTQAQALLSTSRADAERHVSDARTAADGLRTDAEVQAVAVRERAEKEAARLRGEAQAEADRLREDVGRDKETARQEVSRIRRLADEDIKRARVTAAEDAERLTRTAREEGARLLDAAGREAEAKRTGAQELVAEVEQREEEATAAKDAAEQMLAEAREALRKAMSRTGRRLERQRLRREADEERRDTKMARKVKGRQARADRRAGKPTVTSRIKQFVRVNSERLLVILPITAPMAVAWTGQAGFAEDILGWAQPWTVLFAAAFELSTAFVGWMYHQARKDGDAGTLYRVATWVFASGAAVMNFWHASGVPVAGSRVWDETAQKWTEQITYWHATPRAVAFAAMSIVGMVLWELYATLLHRRKLRKDGKVAASRPSIGLVRWFRYPRHAWTAWSLAITDPSLSTLDRAWTAAGPVLADRLAVRSGRTLHRVVVPRLKTGDHGPAAIPAVLTLTRLDRPGPHGPGQEAGAVRSGPHLLSPVRSGPERGYAVKGPVWTGSGPDREGDQVLALESGPADRTTPGLHGPGGPDRAVRTSPAARTAPGSHTVTVRTGGQDLAMVRPHAEDESGNGPDRDGDDGPDRTLITLTDQERTALDRLRSEKRALNRSNIADAVRTGGGSIATDRAGQIAVALKQHAVR